MEYLISVKFISEFEKWLNHMMNISKASISKEIKIILRLFLVIALYCQGSSSQLKSITQPLPLLTGWEGSLGTCSR